MSLPPKEQLARWTVQDVTNWLTESSLTAFRTEFLKNGIDGSKLLRIQPHEIDSKYSSVAERKRQILKDCLRKIEHSNSVLSWIGSAPQLPPRTGGRAAPPPAPAQSDESDGGWSNSSFDDDDIGVDDDYVEPQPAIQVPPQPAAPGGNLNGHNRQLPLRPEAPQCEYEIVDEDQEKKPARMVLTRRTSLVDQLRNQLENRKRDSQARISRKQSSSDSDGEGVYIEPVSIVNLNSVQEEKPPPRPPRNNKTVPDGSFNSTLPDPPAGGRHRPPPPQSHPSQPVSEPPQDVYEIVAHDEPEHGLPQYKRTVDRKKHGDIQRKKSGVDVHERSSGHGLPQYKITEDGRKHRDMQRKKSGVDVHKRSSGKSSSEASILNQASRDVGLPPRPGKQGSTQKQSQAPAKLSSTERAPPPPPQPPSHQQQGGWLFNNDHPAKAQTKDDLDSYEWYHGQISRDRAESIFHREQKDGMFLVRKSERDPQQPYTLMIWHFSRIWNIPIRKVANDKFAAGKCKPNETHFDSIRNLIEHFKVGSLNLKSNNEVQGTHTLTVPAPKR